MKNQDIKDYKSFVIEHYQYFAVGVLFVVLVIVLLVFSGIKKNGGSGSGGKTSEVSADAIGTDPIEVPEDAKLEQNAYEEVNSFFTNYYQAVAEGDVDTMSDMGMTLDENDRAKVEVKAGYTEGYQNMSCYTKPGPEDNSYIVFVYYEIKFKNIDTLAPGLSTFYVCKNDDGSLYMKDISSLPQNMKDYIKSIANQSDVQDLLTQVDTLYQTNTEADATLAAFMTSLQTKSDAAAAKSGEEGSTEDSSTDGAQVRVRTTDAVKIHNAANQDADSVIGQASAGDTFVRLSDDGEWSKIQYKDEEAYIKSEFLTTAEGDTVVGGAVQNADASEGTAQETPAQDTTAEQTTTETSSSKSSGKVTVKEAVTVRASASTDAEKIGSAYKGSSYDLLGEENGWYKISYEGKTAYIKSEFCAKAGESTSTDTSSSSSSSKSSGKITVKEAVTVRASASTDAEKLGSAYKGSTYDLLGEESGWYKISYEGKTAYIKSEFCSKN